MKIAYIYLGAGATESSVQRKIKAQIKALNALGCDTTGIFFTAATTIPAEQDQIQWQGVLVPQKGWFQSLKERKLMTRALYVWAAENAATFDKLYVRNFRPTFWWYWFIRKNRLKVIVEHQTKEIDELKALWNANPFGWRPSRFLSWLEHNIIPYWQEKIYGALSNGVVKKLVAVTAEIAEYEKKRAVLGKPTTYVIGNGIQTKDFQLANRPSFDGAELNLLMMIGGTTETDWHGVDLILDSIEQYKGNCKVKLWVAGTLSKALINNPHVKYLGFCDRKQLDEICNQIHIAVGSFASLRKGLMEGSSLKMREYAARGIPAIIGQEDIDLTFFFENKLMLQFPSMKAPEMESIVEFTHYIYSVKDFNIKIKKACLEHLDYSIKMNKMLNVILN